MQTKLYPLPEILYAPHTPVNFVGRFTVVHKSGISKFSILDLAIQFFYSLEEEATVWDVTDGYVLLMTRQAA